MSDESEGETGPAQLGEIVSGRYEIVKMLGAGGMGAVYQAKQISMDRMVALKLIHPRVASHQDVIKRFRREMQATSRIEHPNIIAVFDYGEDNGRLFLAMEFLPGRPLTKEIERGALPEARMIHIAQQIVRALGAAHQTGIAHRDLKPDNVMLVERYGEPDFVKVLDFGIARFLDDETNTPAMSQMTAAGALIGTPMYMSPEQALGHPIDHRSDFYSLGVMMYQMALGQPPFTGPTLASLIVGHAHMAPPAPSTVKPGALSPHMEALILRLLAKSPDERPANAAELLALLDGKSGSVDPLAATGLPPGAVDPLGATGMPSSVRPAVSPTAQRTAEVDPLPHPGTQVSPPPGANKGTSTTTIVMAAIAAVVVLGGGATAYVVTRGPKTVETPPPGSIAPVGALSPARAKFEAMVEGDGDPLAPAACRTKDDALNEKLAKATAWLHDSTTGSDRPSDRDARLLLDSIKDGTTAEYWAALARARAATEADKPDRALEAARFALDACPNYAMAYNLIGNAELRAKNLDAAAAAYQKALDLAPEYLAPRYNLGIIALTKNDGDAALKAFDYVLEKNPLHPRASLVRGRTHLLKGNIQAALDDLERALLRNPEQAGDWVLLGQARLKAGQEKGAREAFCKAKEKGSAEGAKLCP